VGGVFTAEDALRNFGWARRWFKFIPDGFIKDRRWCPTSNKGLLKLMDRDGFKKIQDVVGTLA